MAKKKKPAKFANKYPPKFRMKLEKMATERQAREKMAELEEKFGWLRRPLGHELINRNVELTRIDYETGAMMHHFDLHPRPRYVTVPAPWLEQDDPEKAGSS